MLGAVLIDDGTETQLASLRTLADDKRGEVAAYTFYGIVSFWVPLFGTEVEMDAGTGTAVGDDGEGKGVGRDGM